MGSLFFLKIMAKKKIQDLVAAWMESYGKENGYELSRCEFVKEGQTWYLRVYVDRLIDGVYDYMTSDDCEIVSRYLSECLDKEDPIEQNYYLEVSSPGLDRPLLSDKDFKRFLGSAVEIKLYKALDGKKFLEGILEDYSDGKITLKTEKGDSLTVLKEETAKVNLAVIF